MIIFHVLFACTYVYVSFIGWGKLIFSLLKHKVHFFSAAAFGMAFLCVLGGLLNCFHLISANLIYIIIFIGFISFLLMWKRDIFQEIKMFVEYISKERIIGSLFLLVILLFLIISSSQVINAHDDAQSYMVYPHQMLQIGGMEDDPFNEGRFGVLGGQAFLNAIMLSFLPARFMGIMDQVIGWVIFIGLVLLHGYQKKITASVLLILVLIFHFHAPPSANISSLITSLALFFMLFKWFFNNQIDGHFNKVVFTSLLIAALLSLKLCNVVGLLCICLFFGFIEWRKGGFLKALKVFTPFIFAVFMLIPWMISSYQAIGTPFFPFLGSGTYVSFTDVHGAPVIIALNQISRFYALTTFMFMLEFEPHLLSSFFLIGVLICSKRLRDNIDNRIFNFFILIVVAAYALTFLLLVNSRYAYAFSLAAFIFLILEVFSWSKLHDINWTKEKNKKYLLLPIGIWMSVFIYAIFSLIATNKMFIRKIRYFGSAQNINHSVRLQKKAQHIIPEKERMLAVLAAPYLLDFKRNQIFVIDHAGSAGPDGGLPVTGSVDHLVEYLHNQGIHYILYSHADHASYGINDVKQVLNFGTNPHTIRSKTLVKNNLKFREMIESLAERPSLIYKDPYALVLDVRKAN